MRTCPGSALIFVSLIFAAPVAAMPGPDGPPGSQPCYFPSRIYTAASTDAPPAIGAAIASSNGQVAFRTCQDETGTRTYLRAPAESFEGVCRFIESEVIAAPGRKHGEGSLDAPYAFESWNPPDGWASGGPPNSDRAERQFMAVGDGSCPPFDSTRYSWADGISVGLFRAIVALIADLESTPERFDALTAKTTRSSYTLARLRQAVADRHPLEIFSVGDQLPDAQANAAGYRINLYDARTQHSYTLTVEVGAQGLEIQGASELPAI